MKDAQTLLSLRDRSERILAIIQIGITLVGTLASAVGGAGASDLLEPYLIAKLGLSETFAESLSVFIVVIPITYLSVVVGELVPKTLAMRNPMSILLKGAKCITIADKMLTPLVNLLETSTKIILKIFFKKNKSPENQNQSTIEIDLFSSDHQRFILNMVGIEKKQIKDIMLPCEKVNFVRDTDSIEYVTQSIFTSGHTRLPVTKNEKVIGMLHTKEFMALKDSGEQNWQTIIRQSLIVAPNASALSAMKIMQERRNHMMIVCDLNLKQIGIVTLEDILEEIVGDIYDEDDDGKIRKVFAAKTKVKRDS